MRFPIPPDPLESPLWETVATNYLADAPIVHDPSIAVLLPPITEDQTQVPVMVDARALGVAERLAVIADLSPFPLIAQLRSMAGPALLALRMRVEQGTVVRGAVLKDGRWHVGSRYLDAAGGGCSAPPPTEARIKWDEIGHMRAALWRDDERQLRLRLRIVHPMDTGLHNEPAYYLQSVAVRDAFGAALLDMDVHEPVAADPVFTLAIADPGRGDHIRVTARDNDGGEFTARVPMQQLAAAAPIREGRL